MRGHEKVSCSNISADVYINYMTTTALSFSQDLKTYFSSTHEALKELFPLGSSRLQSTPQ